SEEHTSELQSLTNLVCRLLLEKKNLSAARSALGGFAVPPAGQGAVEVGLDVVNPIPHHHPLDHRHLIRDPLASLGIPPVHLKRTPAPRPPLLRSTRLAQAGELRRPRRHRAGVPLHPGVAAAYDDVPRPPRRVLIGKFFFSVRPAPLPSLFFPSEALFG